MELWYNFNTTALLEVCVDKISLKWWIKILSIGIYLLDEIRGYFKINFHCWFRGAAIYSVFFVRNDRIESQQQLRTLLPCEVTDRKEIAFINSTPTPLSSRRFLSLTWFPFDHFSLPSPLSVKFHPLFLGMISLFLGKERAILRNRLTIRLTGEEKDQKRRNQRERNTGIVFEK